MGENPKDRRGILKHKSGDSSWGKRSPEKWRDPKTLEHPLGSPQTGEPPKLTSPLRYSGFPSIVRMFWMLQGPILG